MSRSSPYPSKPAYYRKPRIEDLQYRELHWTEQLKAKPLRDQVRKTYEQGDFSTYSDMDRDDYDNFKETTQ